jgi:transcriptional regulator with XRE-family HTH domain
MAQYDKTNLAEESDARRLGEFIRKARTEQNLTQQELGEKAGVHRSRISLLERGGDPVTLRTLTRVLRELGVTTASVNLDTIGNVELW